MFLKSTSSEASRRKNGIGHVIGMALDLVIPLPIMGQDLRGPPVVVRPKVVLFEIENRENRR